MHTCRFTDAGRIHVGTHRGDAVIQPNKQNAVTTHSQAISIYLSTHHEGMNPILMFLPAAVLDPTIYPLSFSLGESVYLGI